VGGGHRWPP